MPLIVTDADVLAQVQADDGAARAVDAGLSKLGAKVPAATVAAWAAYFAAYKLWSQTTIDAVSGGFVTGAWFGVPEMGDQAVAKAQELTQWQRIVNAIGSGQPAPIAAAPVDPATVSDQNAALPGTGPVGISGSTLILGGAVLAVVAILALRR